jgi:hypothetical protein
MTESALRCCFAHLMRILRLDRLRLRVPPSIRQNWHSVDGQLSAPPNNSSKFRRCSVNEFFVLHFSVCPLLNGYLVHVEPAQIGVIEINTINDVRLVARNYVAVTSERSFRLDLRKKVLLESTTGLQLPTSAASNHIPAISDREQHPENDPDLSSPASRNFICSTFVSIA